MRSAGRSGWLLGAAAVALVLPGCAAVPNLSPKPAPRAAQSYEAGRTLAGATPVPASVAAWPDGDWWQSYGDPQLTQLIEEGIATAPDLAAAVARLRQADGYRQQAGAALLPTADAGGQIQGVKQSYNNGIPAAFVPHGWNDTGRATLDFSLDLDLWGKNRANLRAAPSDAEAARLDVAQTRLLLSPNIAGAYADLARLYAERDIADQALRIQMDTAGLVSDRVRNGLDTEGQRRQAAAQVPAARADLAALDEQIAIDRRDLAALIGAGPDRGLAIVRPKLAALAPLALPPAAGIDLVGRRPDIVAARARVEAAAQRIRAAKAAYYPDISLSALLGFQALSIPNLASGNLIYATAGPAISLPLFDSGKREVRAHNFSGRPNQVAAKKCDIAGPAADIEDAHAFCDPGSFQEATCDRIDQSRLSDKTAQFRLCMS